LYPNITPTPNEFLAYNYIYIYIYISTPKQSNCKKRCGPCKKKQHEKSCEIKGGGPEVAVVV